MNEPDFMTDDAKLIDALMRPEARDSRRGASAR